MAYSWSQSALATLHIDSAVFDLQQLTQKAHYWAEVCLKDTTNRQPHLRSRVYATLNYSLRTAYAAVLSALTQTNSDHQEVATKFPVHFHHHVTQFLLAKNMSADSCAGAETTLPNHLLSCNHPGTGILQATKMRKGRKMCFTVQQQGGTQIWQIIMKNISFSKIIFWKHSFCAVNIIRMWVTLCICKGIMLTFLVTLYFKVQFSLLTNN